RVRPRHRGGRRHRSRRLRVRGDRGWNDRPEPLLVRGRPMSGGRYAYILAGGAGTRLCLLSERRAKPAVPFGGKYRIIDFTLSNCVNSGIYDVGVLTQYRPTSLNQHVGTGRPWDLDRTRGGIQLLQPSL